MNPAPSNPTHFVGIDVAKEVHVSAGIVPEGQVVFQGRRIPYSRSGLEAFDTHLVTLCPRATTLIGIEATGHYWIQLRRFLVDHGWSVVVFNPVLSAAAGRANTRGRVTDADDALTIARVLRDGVRASQVLPAQLEHQRELTRRRNLLAEQRTEEIQHLQAAVDVMFPEFAAVFGRVEKASSLAILTVAPCADAILAMPCKRLSGIIRKASRGQTEGGPQAQVLQSAAALSLAHGYREPGREAIIVQVVSAIRHLDAAIAELDRAISDVLEASPADAPPIADLPGFGPVTTAATVAEFGDVQRFVVCNAAGRKQVRAGAMLAFAGLDPRIRQSGKWRGMTRMSKRGSPHLRRAIMLAAEVAAQRDPWCRAVYRQHKRRCTRMGHWLAVSHVARHLVHAIAAMLAFGDTFTWERFVAGKQLKVA